jgi:vanillate/3-O-methylgallate O-demethylase
VSADLGYITNERAFISIASIDVALSEPGTHVSVLWGEEPNSAKPAVEPHRHVEIWATVAPIPHAQVIREAYHR